jgi:hypothetical protein
VTTERSLAEQVAERLNAALPAHIHVEIPPGTADFAILSTDGWWGTQGFGFHPGSSIAELADQLEIALSGIQDAVAHATNGAWPELEDGELPIPWATIAEDELQFGFGQRVVLPPIPLAALGSAE